MSKTKKKQSTAFHVFDEKYIPVDFKAFDVLKQYRPSVFYMYCAMCFKCYSDKKRLYAQQKEHGGNYSLQDTVITFSQADIKAVTLSPRTAKRAIEQLENIGAIKVIEQNQHRKLMNVYHVNRWDKWNAYLKQASKEAKND